MKPLFFGPRRELFGCFHEPTAATENPVGVLLSYPFFGEYVQQHRLYNRIAERLAERGVGVLRFDWFGTGDSAGDLDDANVDRWRADLRWVAAWLRRQLGGSRIAVMGSRMGAVLAHEFAVEDGDVVASALWDPVRHGLHYLGELAVADAKGLGGHLAGYPADPGRTELLGFSMPDGLRDEIAELSLSGEVRPDHDVLVVGSRERLIAVGDTLGQGQPHVEHFEAEFPDGWLAPEDGIYDVLVPVRPMRATVDWLERRLR